MNIIKDIDYLMKIFYHSLMNTKKLCECGCGNPANVGKRFITGHNGRGRRKKPNIYVCNNCGNSFNTMPHIKNRKYCSSICRDEHRKKLVGIKNPNYKRQKTNCIICGKSIDVTISVLQGKKKQYCSIECGKIARKIALRKKEKKAYGKDGARDRDKGMCVVCGFHYVTAVHHIIKKKDGGTDKLTNLVTLCPNHHWMAHANLISADDLKKHAVDFYYTPEQRQYRKTEKHIVNFRDK